MCHFVALLRTFSYIILVLAEITCNLNQPHNTVFKLVFASSPTV